MVANFANTNVISLDLETTGLNPLDSRIIVCQIGFGDHEYVIDTRKVDITPILPFLASNKWLKIIFGAKFETKFFLHYHDTQINNTFDCFLAERIIYPDNLWNNSFEDLAKKYLDVTLDKKVRKSFLTTKGDFTDRQKKYAAEDVQYLFPLWEKQKKLLEEKGQVKISELEFPVATVVADMELTGVPINVEKWRGKIINYNKELEESRQRMFGILFDDNNILDEQLGMFERAAINIQSQPKMLDALQKLGLDIDKTDERTLERHKHPAAQELLKYRKLQKIISAYGDSIIAKVHPFSGRIHADFKQLGTETGRFSCKEPNLQQMPEEFRECFTGDGDYLIVGADYSQIELRILAEISGDKALSAAFISGFDVHSATAALMFNIPLSDVSKEQRFAAKTINFGIMYGMGIPKLMDSLNVENNKNKQPLVNIRQVQAIQYRYKQAYRQATDWLESAGKRAIREGVSETMYGRKRYYERPQSSLDRKAYERQLAGIERQGANSPIQGTSADITKLAMIDLYANLKDYGFRAHIIIQIHDEIVLLAHKTQVETIKNLVVESMMTSAQRILTHVPIKVDSYIADSWKK